MTLARGSRGARLAARALRALFSIALLGVAVGGQSLLGQGTANPASSASPGKSAVHRTHARSRKAVAVPKSPESVQLVSAPVPPSPPPPDWPVNDKPVPASVEWNGRVLRISAANSSLQQILADVATATGVKVEGSAGDQRVYGTYGPAPARDVLSELLDGSGYNVLMIGDMGQGTPRTLVLTVKSNTPEPNPGAIASAPQNSEEDAEQPEQPEQPDPAMRRPIGLQPLQPGYNRTPQQIMQEIEQRRLMMQQQQGAPVAPQPAPVQPND